jgi:hypothetical protein
MDAFLLLTFVEQSGAYGDSGEWMQIYFQDDHCQGSGGRL